MTDYSALIARLHEEQTRVVMSAAHRYSVDGKRAVNVTTLLNVLDKPQLDKWKVRTQVEGTARAAYANPPLPNEPLEAWTERLKAIAAKEYEHERLSDEAKIDGHQVHSLIEYRLRRMLGQETPRPVVSEKAAFREAGFERWAKDVKLKPLMVEGRVAHRELGYCGTFDLLAEVEGVCGVWDWKKAWAIWPEHHLQSIGYRMCLEAMGWPRMPGYALLMPEGQEPRAEPLDSSEDARGAFLALLKVYRWKPNRKGVI